jgi:hypothetical protein
MELVANIGPGRTAVTGGAVPGPRIPIGRVLVTPVGTLRVVLAMKVAGSSDREVGEALVVSRRTATNRKAAVYSLVEELLEPLNQAERLALLDDVGPELHAALIQSRISTSARQRS